MKHPISGHASSQAGGLVYFHQWGVPLPALSNAGQGPVHAGEEQQDLENQHHGGQDQAEHVARGGVPFIGGGAEKLIPPVDVAMSGANEQSQVAQFGLWEKLLNNPVSLFIFDIWDLGGENIQERFLQLRPPLYNFCVTGIFQTCCYGDSWRFFLQVSG